MKMFFILLFVSSYVWAMETQQQYIYHNHVHLSGNASSSQPPHSNTSLISQPPSVPTVFVPDSLIIPVITSNHCQIIEKLDGLQNVVEQLVQKLNISEQAIELSLEVIAQKLESLEKTQRTIGAFLLKMHKEELEKHKEKLDLLRNFDEKNT